MQIQEFIDKVFSQNRHYWESKSKLIRIRFCHLAKGKNQQHLPEFYFGMSLLKGQH